MLRIILCMGQVLGDWIVRESLILVAVKLVKFCAMMTFLLI